MKAQADYNAGQIDLDWFTTEMLFYIRLYFLLGTIIFCLEYIAMSSFFTLCERQVHRIRKKYLSSVLNQDIAYFDTNEIGKLTQKMSSGIDKIQVGSSDKILIMIRALSSQISGIIIGFTLSWQMTLIMLIVVPCVILTIWGSSRVSHGGVFIIKR
jgi:ATP-binding cassette subfamily B (MDR/TAP) protein 1